MTQYWTSAAIDEMILQTLGTHNQARVALVADGQDIFVEYGMSSLDIFRAIANLERAFSIEIGEHPSDFDRIRTLGGLKRLVADKLLAAEGERRSAEPAR